MEDCMGCIFGGTISYIGGWLMARWYYRKERREHAMLEREQRITAKDVVSRLRPQVQQLRKSLKRDLASLRYLELTDQKLPNDRRFDLAGVETFLRHAERILCRE